VRFFKDNYLAEFEGNSGNNYLTIMFHFLLTKMMIK